jgi:hypothetical protein
MQDVQRSAVPKQRAKPAEPRVGQAAGRAWWLAAMAQQARAGTADSLTRPAAAWARRLAPDMTCPVALAMIRWAAARR